MIHTVDTNLFDSMADAWVNTVNECGIMGKGLALEFKKRFPQMFQQYKIACQNNLVKIGEPLLWYRYEGKPHIIINFPIKKHWRNPSKLEYIEQGLIQLKNLIPRLYIRSVSI